MNNTEIRDTFYKIAEFAINPDVAILVRHLGDLMFAQFQTTSDNNNIINKSITGLHEEFAALSTSVLARLDTNDQSQTDKIETIVDKAHNLSNRFMAVEGKVDEIVELIDLKLEEILAAVSSNDGSTDTTTTD